MSDSEARNGEQAGRVAAPGTSQQSSSKMSRRVAIGTTIGVVGAGYASAVGYPIFRYLNTPVERAATAAQVAEVALPDAIKLEPGTAVAFMFGTRPALLIRHEDKSWSAFDAVCTHLGCTVSYESDKDRIYCACHGGTYNPTTGQPTGGPPPKALTQYKVEVKDGQVVVARS